MVAIQGVGLNNLKKTNSVSFKGHNLTMNDKGEKTYKFFLPKVMYSNATVVLKKFYLDNKGNIDTTDASDEISYNIPSGRQVVEVNPKDIDLMPNQVLGYKFVIDGNSYNDKHRFIETKDGKYNIADMLSCDVLQTPKSIYHLMPITFNPNLKKSTYVNAMGESVISDDKTAVINPFLKYDASIQGIINKIPHIKSMGFRRVLATPIFGQDSLSAHGYWTNNPFQITEKYGNMSDFQKLQIELFKNSLGYIADGAFTNEGFMGIHMRDIIRYGANSPFTNWFELFNYPNKPLAFGILPDNQEAYKYCDIRVVNSPIHWDIDKFGKPAERFGTANKNYNPKKETYIQLYDKRLTSKDQLSKDELFNTYDIRSGKDSSEIADWMDSVQPYAFPVKASDIIKKAKLVKKNPLLRAKDFLLNWENFEITNAKESSGVQLWIGNKDIAKLRFVLPQGKQKNIIENAESYQEGKKTIEKAKQATQDVQKYIIEVGKFWTNKTSKTLREYIANQLGNAKNSAEFKKIIMTKAGKDLPESMKYLTQKQIENALNDNYEVSIFLQTPDTVEDSLKEYPAEALEVSDDITSIFAYPEFKKDESKTLTPVMTKIATQILRKLDEKHLPYGKFLNGGELSYDNLKTLQLISDDIKRFLLIKGLDINFPIKNITSTKDISALKDLTTLKLGIHSNNPTEREKQLVSIMKNNIAKISPNDIRAISDYLATRLKNITPNKLKVADLILDKTEAGLNWRIDAAKDVADIESFAEDESSMKESWGEIFAFWKKFNDGVKMYNAHSYKIGEFTDTDATFYESNSAMKNAGDIEQKIIEQGGFTTQSNYSYMFDLPQRFYSAMPEVDGGGNANGANLILGKFIKGWNGAPGYLYSGNKSNISYSHNATGNHDKQRIAHTFSINTLLAYKSYRDEWGNIRWSDEEQNAVINDLLASSMEKSEYYFNIKTGAFDEIFKTISPKNLAKMAAYSDAFNKAMKKSRIGSKMADKLMTTYAKALDTIASKDSPREKMFFYKNFEDTYSDILEIIKEQNKASYDSILALMPKVHEALSEPIIKKEIELAKFMVAMPGSPTLFAGDELAEFGGEEKAKNLSSQNRGRLHWEHLSTPAYKHVSTLKDELAKIYNLRNDRSLSALVDGDTIFLKKQGVKNGRGIVGLYRYNENNDSIILMQNADYSSARNISTEPILLDKIDLSNGEISYGDENYTDEYNTAVVGLPEKMKLATGTIFVDALNPKQKFIVKKDGNIYSLGAKKIIMKNSVLILKRA